MHRYPPPGRGSPARRAGPQGRTRRRWRRLGRKGQVAPVATILGLLLVVTFIANYLTATLPGQMSANDLNHEVVVENELGKLSALLVAVSDADVPGAEVSQAVALGSAGQPPFAGPDPSVLSRGNLSGGITIRYNVTGPGPTTRTVSNVGMPGASILLYAQNRYAPAADIAYDQGAVVYAQGGGGPELIDPPTISYLNGHLSVWIPSFQGTVATEAGSGSAFLYARLVAVSALSYPVNGFSIPTGSAGTVSLTVVTPFPSIWFNFLNGITPTSITPTCTGIRNVCTSSYQPSGPSGTVTVAVPNVTSLTVEYATYSIAFA